VDGGHSPGQVDPAHYKWLKLELAKKALAAEATAKTVTDLLAERQKLQDKVHKLEVSSSTPLVCLLALLDSMRDSMPQHCCTLSFTNCTLHVRVHGSSSIHICTQSVIG
jgi:hypothetical protein